MIARVHLVKLLHQLKTVQIASSIRFSTETSTTTTTTAAAAAATKAQSKADDFLKYGLYSIV